MRTEHLSLEECLMLYLTPDGEHVTREHLNDCPECLAKFRSVQQDMRSQAAQFRQQLDEKPEYFWSRQRSQILSRVREIGQARSPIARLFDLRVWATVASIFIFSVVLFQLSPYRRDVPAGPVVLHDDVRDDQLLREINQAIRDDNSDPLRPLDLLVKVPKSLDKVEAYDGTS
ncbi:MAG TPA: hypothetical protein VGK99_13955 [Acidobacteriota bacterium]|jgi:hypothetical protein